MNYAELKNDFQAQTLHVLRAFSTTEENKAVYALVFDCDLSNGQIVLRYSNLAHFERLKQSWNRYRSLYKPYGQNGLFGLKYNSVGDFPMLECKYRGITEHFLDSYYYYLMEHDYKGIQPITAMELDGQILEGERLRAELKSIFIRMITDTITDIKNRSAFIDYADDALVFLCDHDFSNTAFAQWVRKTNDADLVDRLARILD